MSKEPKNLNAPRRRIIGLLRNGLGPGEWEAAAEGLSKKKKKITPQRALAHLMEVKESSLSRVIDDPDVSISHRDKILDLVVPRCTAMTGGRIRRIAEGIPDDSSFDLQKQRERSVEMPERDAWCFALQYRNALMLDRLAAHADAVGLKAIRLADGIRFEGAKHDPPTPSDTDALWPCPRNLGLKPGMVVLLGDPRNHPAAGGALRMFERAMKDYGCAVRVSIQPEKPNFFGYPTTIKWVNTSKGIHFPVRGVNPAPALQYTDIGVILSGDLRRFDAELFGGRARHLVLICGLHRAATGFGLALLEDLDFRSRVFREHRVKFEFPSNNQMGALVYSVTIRCDNRSWPGITNSQWAPSKIEKVEILEDWMQPIGRTR
jgi:hypothetical protein